MLTCILLTAGLSARFGSPKALANFKGRAIIEHLQEKILTTPIAELIIVTGANAAEILPHIFKHEKIKVVYNKDYYLGQTSSFKTGLLHVGAHCSGVMLWPVDYPAIKADSIITLSRHFLQKTPHILVPTYQDHKGHPPVFHINLREEFLAMDNSVGLNMLARKFSEEVTTLPLEDPAILKSFNTREEFEELKEDGFLI